MAAAPASNGASFSDEFDVSAKQPESSERAPTRAPTAEPAELSVMDGAGSDGEPQHDDEDDEEPSPASLIADDPVLFAAEFYSGTDVAKEPIAVGKPFVKANRKLPSVARLRRDLEATKTSRPTTNSIFENVRMRSTANQAIGEGWARVICAGAIALGLRRRSARP
jgi:hypothetical protein